MNFFMFLNLSTNHKKVKKITPDINRKKLLKIKNYYKKEA